MRNNYGYPRLEPKSYYDIASDAWPVFRRVIVATVTLAAITLILASVCQAYTDEEAINAIIGEAESEPWIGKVSVGEVIRRRGSLRGVYGARAPRVLAGKYSKATYNECRAAWAASARTNYSRGAMGWGNAADIKKFQKSKWFKKCNIVVQINRHFFWKG